MIEKFTGIVLDVTRHTDRHNVLTLYTQKRGRMVFLVPVGSGRNARMRNARLQPLAVIEGDFNFRPNSELQKLGAFSMSDVWAGIYRHPVKQLLALFLSEFLDRFLRAAMPDLPLWDFVTGSVSLLDGMESGLPDFHIGFLVSLLPFAGIQPDASKWEEGMFFDMQSGGFTSRRPLHRDWLEPEESAFAAKMCRIDFSNLRALRLNGETRGRILGVLLHYYGLHFPGCDSLKSPAVLHDIFHS